MNYAGWRNSPQDHHHLRHQRQVLAVSKTTFKFRDLLEGITKFTKNYCTHNYGFLAEKLYRLTSGKEEGQMGKSGNYSVELRGPPVVLSLCSQASLPALH